MLVALHGSYYGNNFGDLLLLKIFEKWIKSHVNCEVVYPMLPKSEEVLFRKHFPNAEIGLSQYRSWKALICAGGGSFGEPPRNTGKTWGGDWDKNFFKRHVPPLELCLWSNIPYAIMGVEAGPLSCAWTHYEIKRLFKSALALSVRNDESQKCVQERFKLNKTFLTAPDAALAVSNDDIPPIALEKVHSLLKPYGDSVFLGIHKPSRFLDRKPEAEAMRNGLLKALRDEPEVIPVIFSDSGDASKSTECKDLSELIFDKLHRQSVVLPFQDIWETLALISKLSGVLTTKLHVGIVSYALGVYCESFATHQKTPRFYRQILRANQSTYFTEVNEEIVIEKVKRAVQLAKNRVSIKDETWMEIKKSAMLHQELVRTFLDSALKLHY